MIRNSESYKIAIAAILLSVLLVTVNFAQGQTASGTAQVGVITILSTTLSACSGNSTLTWGAAITPPITNASPVNGYCSPGTNHTNITFEATTNTDVSSTISSSIATNNYLLRNAPSTCTWPGCIYVNNQTAGANASGPWGNLTWNTRRGPDSGLINDVTRHNNQTLDTTADTLYSTVSCPCGTAVNRSIDFSLSVPTGTRAGNHSAIVTFTLNSV